MGDRCHSEADAEANPPFHEKEQQGKTCRGNKDPLPWGQGDQEPRGSSPRALGLPVSVSAHKVLDLPRAGLRMGPEAPEQLEVSRIAVAHLPVLQVPLLHQDPGDELPGLPIDEMLPPGVHLHNTEKVPHFLLRDPASPQEDNGQDHRQEAGLGPALLFIQPIPGETQGGDQDI
ncbi:hypothetical protein MC885_015061, partial [Smutsia gigantea]